MCIAAFVSYDLSSTTSVFQNMRMVSKYYTQITFDRLAELLDFPINVSFEVYTSLPPSTLSSNL